MTKADVITSLVVFIVLLMLLQGVVFIALMQQSERIRRLERRVRHPKRSATNR